MKSVRVLCALLVSLWVVPSLVAQETTTTDDEKCATVSDTDLRCKTEVSLYTGLVIDSFAAKELNNYINPDDSNAIKSSFVAGVDVAQYMGGGNWLYIETVNGVRSSDVDCAQTPTIEVCKDNPATNQQFLYILRNARSLEAFVGVRHEFTPKANANGFLYVKSQMGFIDVAGSGQDIVDNHIYGAVGFMSSDKQFARSYVEVGVGKTDLFKKYGNQRVKFDGFLTKKLPGSDSANWFMQMTVDSDFRKGPDSIQIYIGLDFDLRKFAFKL